MLRLRFIFGLIGLGLLVSACGTGPELTSPTTRETSWRLVNPRPFDVRINDMWGTSAARVMAVGRHGAIMVRESDRWREAPRPTTTDIFDIHGCDWQHVWAVCEEGLLFFDGSQWSLRRPGPQRPEDRVFCRAADDVMLVTGRNESFHFDGQTWTRQELAVWPVNLRGEWLLGWSGGYTVAGWAGETATWHDGRWAPVEVVDPELRFTHVLPAIGYGTTVASAPPQAIGYRDGQPQEIEFHVRHGADRWFAVDQATIDGIFLDAVPAGQGLDIYLVSRTAGGDTIRVRRDIWDPVPILFPGLREATMLVFSSPFNFYGEQEDFVLAGSFGSFYAGTHDEGVLNREGGPLFEPFRLFVWPNGDFTGMDSRSRFIHGRHDGISVQAGDPTGTILALWGPTPDTIYAVGTNGQIIRLSPGSTPETMPSPSTENLTAIWGSGPDQIFAGGINTFLEFDGSTWAAVPIPAGFNCTTITGTAEGNVFTTGYGVLRRWDGTDWTTVAEPEDAGFRSMSAAPGGSAVFVLVHNFLDYPRTGSIWRWRDNSWDEVATAPPSADGLVALNDDSVIVAVDDGCFIWRHGSWDLVRHPTTDVRPGRVRAIFGDPAGGIYSINDDSTIHYLDLGGTGLWR